MKFTAIPSPDVYGSIYVSEDQQWRIQHYQIGFGAYVARIFRKQDGAWRFQDELTGGDGLLDRAFARCGERV